MKPGIRDYYIKHYGDTEGAKRMAEHGYAYLDFQLADTESEYYKKKDESFLLAVNAKRKELKSAGIEVYQIHGPWRVPQDATDEDRAERFEKMTKAMVIAKYLGAKYMAVHPLMPYGADSPDNPEEIYAINKKYYTALANVAKNLGVTVCLENMPFRNFPLSSPRALGDFIRDIGSESLKMCFDTGHANMFEGSVGDMLREVSDLVKILHLHDNLGDEDSHLPLYEGNIDWADFAEALFDIGFDGPVSLECSPVRDVDFETLSKEEILKRELQLAGYAKLIAGE